MRKYLHGVDSNQKHLLRFAAQLGASVANLSGVGHNIPDALLGFRGRNILIEIKSPNGFLTDGQVEWGRHWRGERVYVVRTEEDLYALLSIRKRNRIRRMICPQCGEAVRDCMCAKEQDQRKEKELQDALEKP